MSPNVILRAEYKILPRIFDKLFSIPALSLTRNSLSTVKMLFLSFEAKLLNSNTCPCQENVNKQVWNIRGNLPRIKHDLR